MRGAKNLEERPSPHREEALPIKGNKGCPCAPCGLQTIPVGPVVEYGCPGHCVALQEWENHYSAAQDLI